MIESYMEEAFDGIDDNYMRENGTLTSRLFTFNNNSIAMSTSIASVTYNLRGYIFY